LIIAFARAGSAKNSSPNANFTPEVNAFAARFTDNAFPFVAGKFFGRQIDFHPLRCEKIVIRNLAVGKHLLGILVGNLRMHLPRQRLGRFFGGDANRLASTHIDECCGNFSPIPKFKSALPKPAASDHRNRVGSAAVNLDKRDQAFAILTGGIVDAEPG